MPGTISTSIRWTAAAVAVVAMVVGPVGAGRADPAQGTCAQPYLPVFGYHAWTGGEVQQSYPDEPVPVPDVMGTSLSYLDLIDREYYDTDGDGQRDQVEIELSPGHQVLVVRRGDGTIRVDQAGRVLGLAASYPVGDLDGDGRDEIYFLARTTGSETPTDRYFLLPGTTAPGSHQASDVAVEIPESYPMWPVGQQGGGPGNDLLTGSGGEGGVVDGHDVMAGGAGSSVGAFTYLFGPWPGQPGGVLALHDGPPTLAMVREQADDTLVTLWDAGATTVYRTPPGRPFSPMSVTAFAANGVRALLAGRGDRGGSDGYLWNLDDPCTPLPEGRTVTTVPTNSVPPDAPAQPVDAEADFTG